MEQFPQQNMKNENLDANMIEKQRLLDEARAKVEKIVDALSNPIDEGIKEGIAVFNALGINTTQSCEGHEDWGTGAPYIDVESKDSDALLKQIDELPKHPDPDKENPERDAILHKVLTKNLEERKKLILLLDEFYRDRQTPFDARIHIQGMAKGWSRLESQGAEFQEVETNGAKKKEALNRFQREMQELIAFTKKKFLSEGPDGK